jgi:hypothetical protein
MRAVILAAVTATAVAGLAGLAAAQSQGGMPPDAASQSQMPPGPRSASEAIADAQQKGMQIGMIHDPRLNMDAYAVVYPPKWLFQGAMSNGSPCSPVPSPIFRLTSPDGLEMFERLPTFDWKWGNSPEAMRPTPGCLPLQGFVSAKEFLKQFSAILQVEYVGEDTLPPGVLESRRRAIAQGDAVNARRYIANGMTPPISAIDVANANVRFKNGTYSMVGRLMAEIFCVTGYPTNLRRQQLEGHNCHATVRYLYAPEGQLQALLAAATKMGAIGIPEFNEAWNADLNRRTQQNIAATNAFYANMAAQQGVQQQQFAQQQAVQLQQHDQFLATMQRGTDMSMQRAAQVANTQHTIASDYVDYSLGQQTYRNPATGQTAKVASGSAVTWLSADGTQSFQAPDPNANPNGVVPGTWNRGQQTHGDGSPYP